jgi:hypothetical protein
MVNDARVANFVPSNRYGGYNIKVVVNRVNEEGHYVIFEPNMDSRVVASKDEFCALMGVAGSYFSRDGNYVSLWLGKFKIYEENIHGNLSYKFWKDSGPMTFTEVVEFMKTQVGFKLEI